MKGPKLKDMLRVADDVGDVDVEQRTKEGSHRECKCANSGCKDMAKE